MKHRAFTLAEVLIVLGIIGIIAECTIPTLISSFQEKQTVVAVKNAYALFSQAFLQIANENYGLDNLYNPNQTQIQNNNNFMNELVKKMKVIRVCNKDSTQKCMNDDFYNLAGKDNQSRWDDWSSLQTGILANGMTFWEILDSNSGIVETQLLVDINGSKKPNRLGVDEFFFAGDSKGMLLPGGVSKTCITYNNLDSYCNRNDKSTTLNGFGCTALLLKNENMDYTKCDGITMSGDKTRCD